ncbi:keratin, type I cytoskeletal 13-like [Hypanus sabinus]|uniref:keratin, type I cytoskeletal 13-like n=2 Tax=Hypanus sabinus TaxID=79690 RepID=UPI0028C41471|nr:keratin, type I cytoskeletal 13-like [Hypanus sabinus]
MTTRYNFGNMSRSSNRSLGRSVQRPSFTSFSMQSYGSRPQTSISSLGYGRGASVLLGPRAGIVSALASGSFSIVSGGCMTGNEKDVMQGLNDRLGKYLDKVQMLEACNKDLEKQIRELTSSNTVQGFDWSIYNNTVKPLQQQIVSAIMDNARIALETDNAKLAAEDFRNKWLTEQMLRQSVETDIEGLHHLKGTYLQLQDGLTNDIAGLEDEIAFLKKNHDEELKVLRKQCTQEVNVEVDSAPAVDLNKVLAEMRQKYTTLVDNNQAELDKWYQEQVSIKEVQMTQNDQALTGVKTELSQLRSNVQTLEADYNGLLGTVGALENMLAETEDSYAKQLQNLQLKIRQLESELASVRNEVLKQNSEYNRLLDIKMKLEAEINQYKILLDGGQQSFNTAGISSSNVSYSSLGPSSSVSKTRILTERVTTR